MQMQESVVDQGEVTQAAIITLALQRAQEREGQVHEDSTLARNASKSRGSHRGQTETDD